MTDALVYVVVWLNAIANALGSLLFAPIGALPGWLSATVVSAVTGVILLVAYKYTSRQRAIKKVKNDIKANLLALKLFKDSVPVTLSAQGRVFLGAFRLLALSIVPMLIMIVPVLLILGQLALWYQARPLRVGEDAVVTVKLNGKGAAPLPNVQLKPTKALEVTAGPVRVVSQREVCWQITARQNGYQRLEFQVDGQTADKELAVGDGFMRVSTERPQWAFSDVLLNPAEPPFSPESPIQSIQIEFPQWSSSASGTDSWVIHWLQVLSSWSTGPDSWVYYWFVVSMISALCFGRVFNVNM